ncbi:MT-A70-domain-containing protein [Hygrophoropsis aurantiaca]|uniref:MT-A70-domain-containing protein n=1 Tax=Hygrophoropsis aurantiaca TaxID=72124 RepID=A0ACB8ATR9_9AGAM|nr:MT-A70-domain-containing protein [Hygrophoropsis aurantiaca]
MADIRDGYNAQAGMGVRIDARGPDGVEARRQRGREGAYAGDGVWDGGVRGECGVEVARSVLVGPRTWRGEINAGYEAVGVVHGVCGEADDAGEECVAELEARIDEEDRRGRARPLCPRRFGAVTRTDDDEESGAATECQVSADDTKSNNGVYLQLHPSMAFILVSPATRGLGLALARHYLTTTLLPVYATHRHPPSTDTDSIRAHILRPLAHTPLDAHRLRLLRLDLDDEPSIAAAATQLAHDAGPGAYIHTAVFSAGVLVPEKQPADIDLDALRRVFHTNVLAHMLLVKHFSRFLPPPQAVSDKDGPPAKWVHVSARVGSISDNTSGGWYSYRASKAALNQLIKTFDLHLQMKRAHAIAVGVHPGTVKTDLSRAYWSRVPDHKLFTPEQSAEYIADVVARLRVDQRGRRAQSKLRSEKLVKRHLSEGSPRNALVKGEGVPTLACGQQRLCFGWVDGCRGTTPPTSATDILINLISSHANFKLKLTDLTRVKAALEALSRAGSVTISTQAQGTDTLVVTDIHFGRGDANPSSTDVGGSRKRKRDEDADSAAGDEEDEGEGNYDGAGAIPGTTAGVHGHGNVSGGTGGPVERLTGELREVYALLQQSTAKGRLLAERFRSADGAFEPICAHITKHECAEAARKRAAHPTHDSSAHEPNPAPTPCTRVHFRPLLRPHTDPTLGHCSYLNTCYSEPTYAQSPSIPAPPFGGGGGGGHAHGGGGSGARVSLPSGLGAGGRGKEKAPCRYLHFEIDWDERSVGASTTAAVTSAAREGESGRGHALEIGRGPEGKEPKLLPPQWINCDLRSFDYSVLGKFHVIMADPPWDIHMSLPYGTMTDDEMRAMPIPMLQDEGMLFLWVTGRAMEVGRECLRVWGYTRVDEVVWVKTNQLQRVIRTGRTGHWLNHTKEHMLVGIKNPPSPSPSTPTPPAAPLPFPAWANRGLSTDVIVSEVRETSRKPDEVYGLIERLCPGGRKIEIFGRRHNVREGWLTLGNQLGRDEIWEEALRERVWERYPERKAVGVGVGVGAGMRV